jgi:hypothetical protein
MYTLQLKVFFIVLYSCWTHFSSCSTFVIHTERTLTRTYPKPNLLFVKLCKFEIKGFKTLDLMNSIILLYYKWKHIYQIWPPIHQRNSQSFQYSTNHTISMSYLRIIRLIIINWTTHVITFTYTNSIRD